MWALFIFQWLNDVNSKVMLANEDPVPIMLLANKVDCYMTGQNPVS